VKVFREEKHLDDFLDGRIYFNRIAFFKSYTNEQGEKRGDPLEGCIGYFQTEIAEISINGVRVERFLGSLAVYSDELENRNAFCLYSIDIPDQRLDDLDYIQKNFKLDESNFPLGEHAVFVQDVAQFVERLNSALQNSTLESRHMYAKYIDKSEVNEMFPEKYWGFHKSDEFIKQNEYRVVIDRHELKRN
jgi:hypothetical protein